MLVLLVLPLTSMTFSIFTLLFTIFNRIEILDLMSLWEGKKNIPPFLFLFLVSQKHYSLV